MTEEIENDNDAAKYFEEWASKAGMDVTMHPLHYLFLDPITNAARQAWKAALDYTRKVNRTPPAADYVQQFLTVYGLQPAFLLWLADPDQQKAAGVLAESAIGGVMNRVAKEVTDAKQNWPEFNSAHEGWGVLKEEIKELTDHVFTNQKRRDLPAMQYEAIQVAAMAIRFASEVCDERAGRK